jgi:phosphoribosylformylglycinamidine (FGAM) synthase PurS component
MEEKLQSNGLAFWVDHVNAYEREAKPWETRSKKIVKRYRAINGDANTSDKIAQYNILWSNVQTLHPALYSGTPTPNVDRRFEDDEEVNTTVAQILERSVSYFVKTNDFDDCMNQAVLDRLLPGRGTCWARYVPNFKDVQVIGNEEVRGDGVQLTDDVETGDDVEQELYSEDVVLDYVHWQDFGHSVARTWQESRAVWRKVYLSKKELKDRFGDKAKDVPLDATALGKRDDDKSEGNTKAVIYELWDRVTKKAYWFHKDIDDFLDVKDDPLELSGFYPCPRPIFATLGNDSLIPTPDYVLYQAQARELDTLTARIDILSRALKIVGVYDSSAEGVQRMLSENVDNQLIPVSQWAVFAEKGGLKGVVDFMPIEMVANVLSNLYQARDKVKQDIYEITGISDIVRGATNANETATAQQIKGQFATLRLDNMQKEVSRFARDCVKLMTEIIAEHFSLETLKNVSGVRLLTEQEKMMAQQTMQMQQPLPEHIQKMLKKPTWEQVESVLRENGARCFRIDIETDSTIKADQEAEKAARSEFLTAAGGFIQQAAQIPSPELQPLLMEMLEFGVRGFKVGRELETEFKIAKDALKAKGEQPPAPQADPMQGELALEDKRLASNERIEQMKIASNEKIEQIKTNADVGKHRMTVKATAAPEVAMTDGDLNEGGSPLMAIAQMMQAQSEQTNQALIAIAQNQAQMMQVLNRQKTVNVKRDASGKMLSAEVI